MYLIAFPLLLVPFALYNMVAFLLNLSFSDTLFNIPLLAGRRMPVSTGDAIVLIALLLLYLEFLKVMRLHHRPIMDHLLSLMLLGATAFEFLAVPKAATSTFLILLGLSFIDAIGGLSLAPRRQRLAPADATDRFSAEYDDQVDR
jgi:hypothetical protein